MNRDLKEAEECGVGGEEHSRRGHSQCRSLPLGNGCPLVCGGNWPREAAGTEVEWGEGSNGRGGGRGRDEDRVVKGGKEAGHIAIF